MTNKTLFLRIVLTLSLCLSFVTPAKSETTSRAAKSSSDVRLQDMEAAADKINKKSYDHYLSYLNEIAKDPGIKSASMLLYYDGAFFKDETYKKMIIFYFGNDKILVDEYYPIINKKYVVRMKLNVLLQQNQLNIESFLQEYERMKKTVLSRYIFVDERLQMVTETDSEPKNIEAKMIEEGRVILEREKIAVRSVVMD
jgi:hypothetical protein